MKTAEPVLMNVAPPCGLVRSCWMRWNSTSQNENTNLMWNLFMACLDLVFLLLFFFSFCILYVTLIFPFLLCADVVIKTARLCFRGLKVSRGTTGWQEKATYCCLDAEKGWHHSILKASAVKTVQEMTRKQQEHKYEYEQEPPVNHIEGGILLHIFLAFVSLNCMLIETMDNRCEKRKYCVLYYESLLALWLFLLLYAIYNQISM